MRPVFLGYFPKRRTPPPEGMAAPGVEWICSVSECVCKGPEEWIRHWRHNDWGYYDDPETAWSVVPPEERPAFELHAYGLLPVRFTQGRREDAAVAAGSATPPGDDFEPLGYDVVSRGRSSFFECSPLSCNGWASEVQVNRHCLLDDGDEALRRAAEAEAGNFEPGDYYVMRVLRARRP